MVVLMVMMVPQLCQEAVPELPPRHFKEMQDEEAPSHVLLMLTRTLAFENSVGHCHLGVVLMLI